MERRPDDIFVLGSESLEQESVSEPTLNEVAPSRSAADPSATGRGATKGTQRRPRPWRRPLAAAGLGAFVVALFVAILASRGGDRHLGEPSPALQPTAPAATPRGGVVAGERRQRADLATLRPGGPRERPNGAREREPAIEQAPSTPPPDSTAPAPAPMPAPEPSEEQPTAPSRPPSSGDGSGRGPEFSFER